MSFEEIRAKLGFLRLTRIDLCRKAGLSRFRFYQTEKEMIRLTEKELTAIKSFLERCEEEAVMK